jgi:hypothetical protein
MSREEIVVRREKKYVPKKYGLKLEYFASCLLSSIHGFNLDFRSFNGIDSK